MRPLVDTTLQSPTQDSTLTEPDRSRTSSVATCSMSTLPEALVTRTSPNRPSKRTFPDAVPRITSTPAGHVTSRLREGDSTRTDPSASYCTRAPGASTPDPGPLRTKIDPLR